MIKTLPVMWNLKQAQKTYGISHVYKVLELFLKFGFNFYEILRQFIDRVIIDFLGE